MSEFWRLMEDEFGTGYARVLARDLVLTELNGRTAEDALSAGVDPRTVWQAVCEVQDVPQEKRWGRDIKPQSA